MEYSHESRDRQEKIRKLKEAGVIVYANNYRGKQDIDAVKKFAEDATNIQDVEALMNTGANGVYQTAWRIMTFKSHGKLAFAKIRDHSGDIQICFVKDKLSLNTGKEVVEKISIEGEEKDAFKIAEKFLYMGDYIGVKGDLFFTKHGELTLFVKEFQILSKAIRPLPEKWHGVTDEETIYRQRYLDLIMNDESYQRFLTRSKFVKAIREFYDNHRFIEIETPILWSSASGAAAKPFTTHHNDFDEEFFLRISPETALKKATVGRFERVVEFVKNFRNEWSDPSHMQEFSAIEHYAAWWNFEDNMKFTEDMFDHIFNTLWISKTISIKDKEGNPRDVNFTTPWERIDYVEGVKRESGIDISQYAAGDEQKLRDAIKASGNAFEGIEKMGLTTMIDYLYKKVLRPKIVWPAFVYNYPKTMQPLARQNDANPGIVEQYQVVVNGWEIVKAYSELVDPEIQMQNFADQGAALARGDEEATSGDDDFVLAMEYGMPPQSGWGMWVDRVISLLTGQENLRDVVLFPLMKSEKSQNEAKKSQTTKLAVVLLNQSSNLEYWQKLNTVAHLNASFAARQGKKLFMQESVVTQDGENIKLNIQHAIMMKDAATNTELIDVVKKARETWFDAVEFTREMIGTTDDKKVRDATVLKDLHDVEFLGVLIFGERKEVDALTKHFPLSK